jgi:hypothetical protein
MVILILLIGIFGFIIIAPTLNKAPSCTDGKQNGTETGIDCGGSCALACISQVDAPTILWARSFKVIDGRYNAVAYIENHNKNVAVDKISYRFRFADANNVYIGKREGVAYIPPAGKFAIFEPGIDIGNSVPVYTTFEFTEAPQWVQVSQEKIDQLKVSVSSINLVSPDKSPHLSATIKNNSLFTIPQMSVIVILYDASGNAVSVSSTYIDTFPAQGNQQVTFTWPTPLPVGIVAKEIIPMYNIFLVKL